MGRQQAVHRGQTEGAGLERAPLEELAHQHLDGELRILLPPLDQRLSGLRTERLAGALVLAGLALEGVKTLVAPKVVPALQRGGGVGFVAPGPFAGQRGGAGQREVLL